ncbi:hypothetical protein ACSYDW_06990 [Paeniglutamicibacter sp. R2-26]|uniref:hypothetical protein n=1 Tax=Paeniglutamicibacter sp. R2-26 TaxID=3144417 RepID=UPI003EE708BC
MMKSKLPNFEAFLTRIEVAREPTENHADELKWEVGGHLHDDGFFVVSGHLYCQNEHGYAQTMAIGLVRIKDTDFENLLDKELLREIAREIGCIEALYDSSRRAINAQSALMDFRLDMPMSAPVAESSSSLSSS